MKERFVGTAALLHGHSVAWDIRLQAHCISNRKDWLFPRTRGGVEWGMLGVGQDRKTCQLPGSTLARSPSRAWNRLT